MRSRIFSSLLLATVLAPPAVWAQDADDTQEPEAGEETEGSEVVDDPPARPRSGQIAIPPGQGGRESAPGEVHTVERGDTLWDLSQKYLGSPWYWPKVWSYNPEIANPHWIYPGNTVRFFPAGEEVPSRVETGTGPGEMVAEEGEIQAATE
ncbi:MAG TPA: LysM peptidoglycan-binding domain-containing protein, partial [Archangium sp.]|nr:LysM peptidoglycan-binding domain-containing protein [Archangium sp.]